MFHKSTSLVAWFCRWEANGTQGWDTNTKEATNCVHIWPNSHVRPAAGPSRATGTLSRQVKVQPVHDRPERTDCDVNIFAPLSVVDTAEKFSGLKRLKLKTGSCQELRWILGSWFLCERQPWQYHCYVDCRVFLCSQLIGSKPQDHVIHAVLPSVHPESFNPHRHHGGWREVESSPAQQEKSLDGHIHMCTLTINWT